MFEDVGNMSVVLPDKNDIVPFTEGLTGVDLWLNSITRHVQELYRMCYD